MNFKQLSQHIFYDPRDLDEKVPKALTFLGNSFAPKPFLIIDNFMRENECEVITQQLLADPAQTEAEVLSRNSSSRVDKKERSTAWHSFDDQTLASYNAAFDHHRFAIERFFGKALLEHTQPQPLGYTIGDYYHSHADNAAKTVDHSGNVVLWEAVKSNRVITTVLFLNSDFEGGELRFDYLYDHSGAPIILKPKAGLAVAFPSNPYFAHSVAKVTSGYRLSVAQWHNAL